MFRKVECATKDAECNFLFLRNVPFFYLLTTASIDVVCSGQTSFLLMDDCQSSVANDNGHLNFNLASRVPVELSSFC